MIQWAGTPVHQFKELGFTGSFRDRRVVQTLPDAADERGADRRRRGTTSSTRFAVSTGREPVKSGRHAGDLADPTQIIASRSTSHGRESGVVRVAADDAARSAWSRSHRRHGGKKVLIECPCHLGDRPGGRRGRRVRAPAALRPRLRRAPVACALPGTGRRASTRCSPRCSARRPAARAAWAARCTSWDEPRGFLGTVPIVGATVPLAVGAALAAKLTDTGRRRRVAYLGDGAMEEGVVHESLNLASEFRCRCSSSSRTTCSPATCTSSCVSR